MSTYQSPDQTPPELTLGWRLRMALEHAGLTAAEMMTTLGIESRDTMAAWTHDRRVPKKAYLRQWAMRCGVPFEWLLTGEYTSDPGGSGLAWNVRHANVPATVHVLKPTG